MADTVYDKVATMLTENFGVPAEDLSADATFEDLELDSLDLVEFTQACQNEFGVKIEDDEAEQLHTLGDSVKLLESKGATA